MFSMILRVLGFQALSELVRRLPQAQARLLSATVLLLVNLFPLLWVALGKMGPGDVFFVYWLENVVVWLCTMVRIATAEGGTPSPGSRIFTTIFFSFHFGLFTLVHGVFTVFLVVMLNHGSLSGDYRLVALGILLGHLFSLGLNWFGRGERRWVTVEQAMWAPYPRMLVLHVAILGSGFLLAGFIDGSARAIWAVVLLCGLKTAIDLGLHVRERVRFARSAPSLAGVATT